MCRGCWGVYALPGRLAVRTSSRIWRWAENLLDFYFIEHFALLKRCSQGVELAAVLSQQFLRLGVGFMQNSRYFLIDDAGTVLAEFALFVDFAPQKGMILA